MLSIFNLPKKIKAVSIFIRTKQASIPPQNVIHITDTTNLSQRNFFDSKDFKEKLKTLLKDKSHAEFGRFYLHMHERFPNAREEIRALAKRTLVQANADRTLIRSIIRNHPQIGYYDLAHVEMRRVSK